MKDDIIAGSLQQAASILGCDVALLKGAKRMGCTAFRANNSVNIAQLREWLEKNETGGLVENIASKQQLELRKLRLQCERYEEDLLVARRLNTPNAQIRADMLRIGTAVKAALLILRADAPTWEGLTATEIEARVTEAIDKICANLHDQTSSIYGES